MSQPAIAASEPAPFQRRVFVWWLAQVKKLKRLYRLVEDGLTEIDDMLKDRLNSPKSTRDHAKAALERAKSYADGAVIDVVEVDDTQIRINCSKDVLE